jgi:GTP-dependent phosphoenolpyruvate carboxykinase
MTKTPPAHLIDWKGHDWTPESKDADGKHHPSAAIRTAGSPRPPRIARSLIPTGKIPPA